MSTKYVYLIEQVQTGHTKIGISDDPDARRQTLQHGTPLPISLFCLLAHPEKRAYELEADLHRHFRTKRTYGEWFKMTADEMLNNLLSQPAESELARIEVVYWYPDRAYHPIPENAQPSAFGLSAELVHSLFKSFAFFMLLADISLLGSASGLIPLSLFEFACYIILNLASAGGMLSCAFSARQNETMHNRNGHREG